VNVIWIEFDSLVSGKQAQKTSTGDDIGHLDQTSVEDVSHVACDDPSLYFRLLCTSPRRLPVGFPQHDTQHVVPSCFFGGIWFNK